MHSGAGKVVSGVSHDADDHDETLRALGSSVINLYKGLTIIELTKHKQNLPLINVSLLIF